MEKILLLALIFLTSVSLCGCINNEGNNKPKLQTTSKTDDKPLQTIEKNDEVAVARLVDDFGEKLQTVSLLAPGNLLRKSMQESYSDFVSPALLEEWSADPRNAPGRLYSSPWPDRIVILSMEELSETEYIVIGEIIELTSMELINGGVYAKQPITLVAEKAKGHWFITAVTLGARQDATGEVLDCRIRIVRLTAHAIMRQSRTVPCRIDEDLVEVVRFL